MTMTVYLAYGIVLVMVPLAACAFIAAARLRQLTRNQELAWPYREHLAFLAHDVEEKGKAVPCLVRTSICFLAERAFDAKFMRKILKAEPHPNATRLVDQIREEFPNNPEFGDMVGDALGMMAMIVLLSDRKYAYELRAIVQEALERGAFENARQLREERQREESNPRVVSVEQSIASQMIADVPGLLAVGAGV